MHTETITLALNEAGKLAHILEVPNGDQCKCTCLICGAPLRAKRGNGGRTPHFAHKPEYGDCGITCETALHEAAKRILYEEKCAFIPSLGIQEVLADKSGKHHYSRIVDPAEYLGLCPSALNRFPDARLEHTLRISEEKLRRPDVILSWNELDIAVEVAVSSFIDFNKKSDLESLSMNTIQIDISRLNRNISRDDLKAYLLSDEVKTEWVYNTKEKEIKKTLRGELKKVVEIENLTISSPQPKTITPDHTRLSEAEKRQRNINTKRQQLRSRIEPLLTALLATGDQNRRYSQLKAKSYIHKDVIELATSIKEDVRHLPIYVDTHIQGSEIFSCHHSVWQSGIYLHHIYNAQQTPQSILDAWQLTHWCGHRYGFYQTLYQLYKETKSIKNENQYGYLQNSKYWYLEEKERQMIINPYSVVLKYLESLTSIGLLARKPGSTHIFNVEYHSIETLNEAKETQRKLRLERLRVTDELERESHERRLKENKEKRAKMIADNAERVILIAAMEHFILHTAAGHGLRCNHCHIPYPSIFSNKLCPFCDHSDMADYRVTGHMVSNAINRHRCFSTPRVSIERVDSEHVIQVLNSQFPAYLNSLEWAEAQLD